MIDERAVQAAKFWERLRSVRVRSGLRESEFEQFALMLVSLNCVAQSSGVFPDQLIRRVQNSLNFMRNASEYQDEAKLHQAWFDACDAMVTISGSTGQADVPRTVASLEAFNEIIYLLRHFEGSLEFQDEFLLDCFDEVFHRIIGRLTESGYRNGDSAAALAAHLSVGVYDTSEYFATTGEFAVLRHTLLNIDTYTHVAVIDRLNFFVDLRLKLHGIKAESQPQHEDDLASFVRQSFMLIDHPRRSSTVRQPQSSSWSDHQTSMEALDHLQRNWSTRGLSLIIVPSSDRSAGGWRSALRRHLVDSGLLLAVIDLPQDRRDKSRKQVSAWFLGNRNGLDDHVLMISTHGITGRGELRNTSLLMAYVTAIISIGAPEGWPLFKLQHQPAGKEVEALMSTYFRDGYRDVEGICRRVHINELAQNSYKLAASTYLQGTEKVKRHKTFMSLLNSDPVLDVMRQGQNHSTRIYVIGNNGEGKSILLRDLAERIVKDGQRVVGISFGLTDRFPFNRAKHDDQAFTYVGARTSEQGISLGRTSADLNRLVREIHVNGDKLQVFSAVVKHLGFGERRYLVPLSLNNSFDDDRERYAELQQLTESAEDNARMLLHAGANKYELGLMRQESQRSITRFGELSSGEQQLLTLALKLTAYASDTTVILIDEPEISLHVSWQRAIPGMLELIGSQMGCTMVVATHSPVVIASATHQDDKCFVARQNVLTELRMRQRRSVETALFDGFRTYTANNRQVHERCATIVSETIRSLNANSSIKVGTPPTMESLYEELALMDQIIRSGSSADFSHARHDLELVASTRAALNELTSIDRGNAK